MTLAATVNFIETVAIVGLLALLGVWLAAAIIQGRRE